MTKVHIIIYVIFAILMIPCSIFLLKREIKLREMIKSFEKEEEEKLNKKVDKIIKITKVKIGDKKE